MHEGAGRRAEAGGFDEAVGVNVRYRLSTWSLPGLTRQSMWRLPILISTDARAAVPHGCPGQARHDAERVARRYNTTSAASRSAVARRPLDTARLLSKSAAADRGRACAPPQSHLRAYRG